MAVARVLLVAGSASFSTRDVWDGYRHALATCGVSVIPYPTFSFLKVLSAEAVGNDIIGTALDLENRIDCVIFVDGLYFRGKRGRVPQSIRQAGIPTVLIATDDPYETIANAEALYTYRFTNEIRCAGDDVLYLPTATLPLPEAPAIQRPPYDVSFLGTVFADRLPLLLEVADFCEREQKRFLVAGKILGGTEPFQHFVFTETRQRTIDTLEKWEIYAQSRITLNLFRHSEHPADSPSPRVFEVTAFGHAALLTGPARSEVTRIFGDAVYHFHDGPSAVDAISCALADDGDRRERVVRARAITRAAHLYEHRADLLVTELRSAEQQRSVSKLAEEKIAWLIGCGRTGSTWLAEMLGDLQGIRRWHEPYFGRFFKHLQDRPEELDRNASFFARRHQAVWLTGLRELFFHMVRDRYPQFGRHALVVKEVNTPELYPWLRALFPAGQMILLIRDPFDILDSYLDLQKPGSWNTRFGERGAGDPLAETNVRRTAEHISGTMLTALQAFAAFPLEQRLQLRYEDLRTDPAAHLQACARLLSIEVPPAAAAAVAEKHDFSNYRQTGKLKFRRQGRAGAWQQSDNFTPTVRKVADEILGPLRARMGYREAEAGIPAQDASE